MNGKCHTYETGNGLERMDVYFYEGDARYEDIEEVTGWYVGFYTVGCLYDGEPLGPFDSAEDALEFAVEFYDLDLRHI